MPSSKLNIINTFVVGDLFRKVINIMLNKWKKTKYNNWVINKLFTWTQTRFKNVVIYVLVSLQITHFDSASFAVVFCLPLLCVCKTIFKFTFSKWIAIKFVQGAGLPHGQEKSGKNGGFWKKSGKNY